MVSKTVDEHDVALSENELLKGVPALLPAVQFRQRQRSTVLNLLYRLRDLVDDDGNVSTENPAQIKLLLDLLADADEFFESIAADRDAYVSWATGLKESEQIYGALIAKYARAVGE
jgi:hypothetical protein